MTGPSQSVANAAPIPTAMFGGGHRRVQEQARGNNGTFGSHAVDAMPVQDHIPSEAPRVEPRFVWPWAYWKDILGG